MSTSLEGRLWLAVHLLYPHSSQAFDVYQAVIIQSEPAIKKNDVDFVFSKLVQAFEKIPPVSSNLSFYEFDFDQIDQWKIIYKNSQKTQLLIFVGTLIFELKISDIASHIKTNPEKAQFLFHQIFKKLAQGSAKLKYSEPPNLKKQNETKISYLFTYENLVDYCLGQLSAEDAEKVKTGLELYPTLVVTKDEYAKIINQIQTLKVQKTNSVSSAEKKTSPQPSEASIKKTENVDENPDAPAEMRSVKSLVLSTAVLVLAVSIGIGFGLKKYRDSRTEVVVSEVQKNTQPVDLVSAPAQNSVPSAQGLAAQSSTDASTAKSVDVSVASSSDQVVAMAPQPPPPPPPSTENVKPKPADNENQNVSTETATAEKTAGGLYRGTLLVDQIGKLNQQIAEKLGELGAKKAGEVELGWLKSPGVAYYHYIIPEKNIAESKAYLQKFGKLYIKFEDHPRQIPVGNKRFIIEVKQK